VLGKSFVDFAELPPSAAAELAPQLRSFAERLNRRLDDTRELERARRRRILRWSPLVLVLSVLALGVPYGREWSRATRDLARGRAWTASSVYPAAACASPDQECKGRLGYFFHTREEDKPSLTIDLGEVQTISGLAIRNRTDCCGERAVPLLVEVSVKRGRWTEVARRKESFLHWAPAFEPVQARWVRLRVPRRTALHLASVRVLP
jgi:hypothetical protein